MHITIASVSIYRKSRLGIYQKGILKHGVGLLCWGPFLKSSDNVSEPKSCIVFAVFYIQDQSFNNSENDTMKLQLINEAKLTCL